MQSVVTLAPWSALLFVGGPVDPWDTPQSWVEIRRLVSAVRPRWTPVET